jgi:maleate cis-trans isomerase
MKFQISNFKSQISTGYGWRGTIGFILPSSCLVYEQEFLTITRGLDGVIGVPARLLITACDAAGLAAMNDHIDLAARQLATCDCDVVIYMCTSGSFMDGNKGDEAIRKRVHELTGKPTMSTSQAVIAAMQRFELKRVVMLTPYNEDLTRREVCWLADNGIEVSDFHFGDIPDNLDRGSQSPEELLHLAKKLCWQDADGIFLSCGNVPYLDIVAQLEQHTGKPVIASSLATTWMALRMTGIHEPIEDFGRLLTVPSLQ